jgi:lipoprotein NlpD
MRLSMRLRWQGALWGAMLGACGALSGCALDTVPDTTFSAPCRTVPAGYYCVLSGDTLANIAQGFGRKPQDVAHWNGIGSAAPLRVGQLLRVAPPDERPLRASALRPAAADPTGTVAAEPAHPAATHASAAAQFVWPANGMVIREFGVRGSRGIEIAGRAGMPVKAAAAGRVVYAGDRIKAYGLMVIVKHEDGFVTAYGNNRRLLVREGDVVQRGAAIAEMGTQSDGEALLQFEMRKGNQAVDPLPHLPADSGPVVE